MKPEDGGDDRVAAFLNSNQIKKALKPLVDGGLVKFHPKCEEQRYDEYTLDFLGRVKAGIDGINAKNSSGSD